MSSQHVQDVVGPDGINCNDLGSDNALLAIIESTVHEDVAPEDAAITADYFVVVKTTPASGAEAANSLRTLVD